jgi:hypothetical protein
VGTLFFAREATAGVVAALQDALMADIGLVAFAFAMTVLLARNPVVATEAVPAPAGVDCAEYALADEAVS